MDIKLTTRDVCELFGVNQSTVSRWVKGGMPRAKRGLYDLKAVFDWWNENINAGGDSEDIQSVKLIYWKAKAKIEQLREKKQRGELMHIDTVRDEFVKRLALFRAGHQMLIDRLPPLLEGRSRGEIKRLLREELGKLFEHYRSGFMDGKLMGEWDGDEQEEQE